MKHLALYFALGALAVGSILLGGRIGQEKQRIDSLKDLIISEVDILSMQTKELKHIRAEIKLETDVRREYDDFYEKKIKENTAAIVVLNQKIDSLTSEIYVNRQKIKNTTPPKQTGKASATLGAKKCKCGEGCRCGPGCKCPERIH